MSVAVAIGVPLSPPPFFLPGDALSVPPCFNHVVFGFVRAVWYYFECAALSDPDDEDSEVEFECIVLHEESGGEFVTHRMEESDW